MKENILLFDLDGTLIDSTDAIVSTFYHSFEKMNHTFKGTDEDIKALIGYPLDIMFEHLGVNKLYVWDFVDAYKMRYKDISKQQTLLLENVVQALELAQTFSRMSVVTTKTGSLSAPLLEHMNICHYFEHITGREHVQHPKPHPEPILFTLELMKCTHHSSNIWMIGDTKLDLIAANEAKIQSVGVLCGYGSENELRQYTSNIASNSYEAVKLIQSMLKP
ncbi:MAG: HAD family hydrolase [Candidatus Marinarcus sp.]|uniref:HAD family hydrolase n=1 Tax=Candidatus Marinarcus sp. TaxID=3100987 RepID=UPI003B000D33